MQTRYPTNAESSRKQPKSRINLLSGIFNAVSHKVTSLEVRITYDRQNLQGLWQSFGARLHVGTVEQLYGNATPRSGIIGAKTHLETLTRTSERFFRFAFHHFISLEVPKI
jgi:hypothetical protein